MSSKKKKKKKKESEYILKIKSMNYKIKSAGFQIKKKVSIKKILLQWIIFDIHYVTISL